MPTFSVVVPTLNEEAWIADTLRAAARAFGPDAELVVVDGGSVDGTRERAAPLAAVLRGPRGRGPQMNAGARAASGRILVFLHADTLLDPDAGRRIRECLQDARTVGGCCRFAVHPPPGPLSRFRLLEAGVNLRTRLFRTATGDQAIFVRREAFDRVGGVPDYPLFEDVAFVRRVRRLGRFRPLDVVARTSRRRWERGGFWRTVLLHWALRAAFWAGVSPDRLESWYRPRSAPERVREGLSDAAP